MATEEAVTDETTDEQVAEEKEPSMAKKQKEKGERAEVEVVKLVQEAGWPGASRNFGSGAQGHSDIAHGPQGAVIEVKRAEALRLREWWRQVEADATEQGNLLPILAHRWDGQEWLGVLPLDELLRLMYIAERAA